MFQKARLVWEPEPDGVYTVCSPHFPQLVAEGDTPESAAANVKDAPLAIHS